MAVFCYILLPTDRKTFCWKCEDNHNKPPFQLHTETAPNTICTASCHINTFTLTIPVSHLKAQLITLPFPNSHHTNISTVTIFPHSIHSTVYSSLFGSFLDIQHTATVHSSTLNVSPFFLAVPTTAACCDVIRPERTLTLQRGDI